MEKLYFGGREVVRAHGYVDVMQPEPMPNGRFHDRDHDTRTSRLAVPRCRLSPRLKGSDAVQRRRVPAHDPLLRLRMEFGLADPPTDRVQPLCHPFLAASTWLRHHRGSDGTGCR